MSHVETPVAGRETKLSWVVDLGAALILIVVFWLQQLIAASDRWVAVVGSFLALVVVAAVLTRWVFPSLAPVAALVATGIGWTLGVSTDPMLAVAWCLYPLAVRRGARTRWIGLAAILVMLIASLAYGSDGSLAGLDQRLVLAAAALGASWLLGHVEARRLEAVQRATLERAACDRVMQQTAMAREVHDVVGHALSVIGAEADVARNIPGATEDDLRQSLADIERRSRTALEQVQALVRGLRRGEDATARPAELPELVAAAQASGLDVESRIDLPALPLGTKAVVSRVVQEALSNIVRHSGASRCEIAIWPEEKWLVVRVDDDGTGLPVRRPEGSGLAGMRERVEEVGGTLTVTSRLEGGTRVLARLPLEASA